VPLNRFANSKNALEVCSLLEVYDLAAAMIMYHKGRKAA
jgi:hypothetical protein